MGNARREKAYHDTSIEANLVKTARSPQAPVSPRRGFKLAFFPTAVPPSFSLTMNGGTVLRGGNMRALFVEAIGLSDLSGIDDMSLATIVTFPPVGGV